MAAMEAVHLRVNGLRLARPGIDYRERIGRRPAFDSEDGLVVIRFQLAGVDAIAFLASMLAAPATDAGIQINKHTIRIARTGRVSAF
jgi:hypothetical protein